MPDPAVFAPNQIITHTQLNNAFATKADAVSIAGLVEAAILDLNLGGGVDTAALLEIAKQAAIVEAQRLIDAAVPVVTRLTIGSTSERPAAPSVRDQHFNTEINALETYLGPILGWWSGAAAPPIPPPITAIQFEDGSYWTLADGSYVLFDPYTAPIVIPPSVPVRNDYIANGYVAAGYFAAP